MAKNPWSKRPTELELEVFELVWRRYRQGETDLLDGGVAPRSVAQEFDATSGSVSDVCSRLRDDGIFVELDGADPETARWRRSFAPAALYDGGEQR